MSASALLLLEIIDLCKVAAPVLTVPTLILVLLLKRHPGPLRHSTGGAAAMVVFLGCLLSYAVGFGSCVLGGLLEGQAICGFKPRGRAELHPIGDFAELQVVYAVPFLLTAFLSFMAALWFFPGQATSWQRWIFLVTAGRRGQWR